MTQEEKQLLLKDLSARLPYGVVIETTWKEKGADENCDGTIGKLRGSQIEFFEEGEYSDIKPYLRPMSSMTEEEWETLRLLKGKLVECDENNDEKFYGIINEIHTFYYSHHIDCNGLIEMGLALEATEDIY